MEPQKEEIIAYLQSKKSDFLREANITELGVFGAYGKGEQKDIDEESQIDLLLEFAPHTEHLTEKKDMIRQTLQDKFGKRVNITRSKYLKHHFKKLVESSIIYV